MNTTTFFLIAFILALLAIVWFQHNIISNKSVTLNDWKDYAINLESEYTVLYNEMMNLRLDYGDQITALKIKSGEIAAHRIDHNQGTTKAYVMELPGMPELPAEYRVAMTDGGNLVNLWNPTKLTNGKKASSKANTPDAKLTIASNGHMNRYAAMDFVVNTLASDIMKTLGRDTLSQDELDIAADCVIRWNSEGRDQSSYAVWIAALLTGAIAAPKANGNSNNKTTASNGSNAASSTEPTTFTVDFTSPKFGEYLDLLTDSLNMTRGSKLSSGKFEYAKEKYSLWESSKSPNTAIEYSKRIINAKFGGK